MNDAIQEVAGRELDALVAERVLGFEWRDWELTREWAQPLLFPPDHRVALDPTRTIVARPSDVLRAGLVHVPCYSTDIAAAWTVVEKMLARGWATAIDVEVLDGRTRVGVMMTAPGGWPVDAIEDTAPLAICRAALRALESETP